MATLLPERLGWWSWLSGFFRGPAAVDPTVGEDCPDPLLVVRDGQVVGANTAAGAVWPDGAVPGRTLGALFDAATVERLERLPFEPQARRLDGHLRADGRGVEISARATVIGGVPSLTLTVRERVGGSRLRSLAFEHQVTYAIVLTPGGVVTEVSANLAAGLGRSEREIIGRTLVDLPMVGVDPAVLGRWQQRVREAEQRQGPQTFEEELQIGGESRWFEITVVPVRGEGGQLECVMVQALDVTERFRATQDKQTTDTRLEAALQAAQIVAWEIDLRTGSIHEDGPVASLFGQAVGFRHKDARHFIESVHPDDRASVSGDLGAARRSPKRYNLEFRIPMPDGGMRWIQSIGRLEVDRDGVPHKVLGIARDDTARWMAEQALKEREAQYRAVVETQADGFCILDASGRLIDVNDVYVRRSRYTKEQLLSLRLDELEAGPSVGIDARLERARLAGAELFETTHRAADGSLWLAEVDIAWWPDAKGRYFVFVRDVMRRKRSESLLRTRAELTERAEHPTVGPLVEHALTVAELLTASRWSWIQFADGSGWRRDDEELNAATAEDSATARCFATMEPVTHDAIEDGEIVHSLVLPLLHQGAHYGVIGVRSRTRAYSNADIEVLGVLAEMVAERLYARAGRDELHASRAALITHRAHLEEEVATRTAELAAAESRLRLILESSADGLFGIDAHGHATFVNPAACELLGYSAEELVGTPMFERLVDGAGAEVPALPILETLHQGRPVRQETVWFRHRGGQAIPVSFAARPIFQDGCIVGAVVSFRDVTVWREADAARESALVEAQRLAQVRSDFLANMSHEIRTPLNAVLGVAQVGLRQPDATVRERDSFARILDAGQHLLGVVNDILDVSKAEAGKLQLEFAPLSPGAVVDRAVGLVAARAYAKGLAIWVDEAPGLPASFSGDALRLSQVLLNLLSNAVKFTPSGTVSLAVRREDDVIVFIVTDTGIGMDEAQLRRIFTPFEQADGSTTRRFGGTGLGLSISRMLVEAMGGGIKVRSKTGQGSCFEVRVPLLDVIEAEPVAAPTLALGALPGEEATRLVEALRARGVKVVTTDDEANRAEFVLVPAEETSTAAALRRRWPNAQVLAVAWTPGEPQISALDGLVLVDRPLRARQIIDAAMQSPSAVGAVPSGPRLTGIRILAAEDSATNRFVLEEMLRDEGVSLTLVENGREAIQVLMDEGSRAFDLVLTDIQMPEMDGYETCRRVRAMDVDLPVIGLTAHAMAEERTRCFSAGMVAHLAKPVDCESLVAAVRRHARRPTEAPQERIRPKSMVPAPVIQPVSIDWSGLETMYRGRRAFVDQLAAKILANHTDAGTRLRNEAAREDLKAVAFLAHKVRGVAGTVAASTVMELAGRTEKAAGEGRSDAVGLAEQLAVATDQLIDLLKQRVHEPDRLPEAESEAACSTRQAF